MVVAAALFCCWDGILRRCAGPDRAGPIADVVADAAAAYRSFLRSSSTIYSSRRKPTASTCGTAVRRHSCCSCELPSFALPFSRCCWRGELRHQPLLLVVREVYHALQAVLAAVLPLVLVAVGRGWIAEHGLYGASFGSARGVPHVHHVGRRVRRAEHRFAVRKVTERGHERATLGLATTRACASRSRCRGRSIRLSPFC